MTVENISWSISIKECCRPRRGSNPRPPCLQSDAQPTEPPKPVVGLSVQEKKPKLYFQDGRNFPIRNILAILIFKLPRYCILKFESISVSAQERKDKIDFPNGGHSGNLGFSIGTILFFFICKTHPTKFQISWLFGSGEEAQNRCSRRRQCPLFDFRLKRF